MMSQEEIAPEGSKVRVIINIQDFKILSSIYSIEILVISPKLKKPQTWVSQKAALVREFTNEEVVLYVANMGVLPMLERVKQLNQTAS